MFLTPTEKFKTVSKGRVQKKFFEKIMENSIIGGGSAGVIFHIQYFLFFMLQMA